MRNKDNEEKTEIPKLITFDFIWKTGGLIVGASAVVVPILEHYLKGNTFEFKIKLDIISLSILLCTIIGIVLSIIYHMHKYTKKVNLALRMEEIEKNVAYIGTCTDEELQEAIANSD